MNLADWTKIICPGAPHYLLTSCHVRGVECLVNMVPNRMLPLFLLFEIICIQFELNNLAAVCCVINK